LRVGRTGVWVSVVSESEVFVVIIILGSDFTGRNNSERDKIK